ncbi:type II toxin-antitoxin system VapC family toxin [Planctomicrobium piriforme]|uniref:PIN domain nuclease, a component of toxin-antitoxin system (PIN domain) n=1 Tax=Planctomicrobium piriforme TaxID=1576369 RepID=A0A1I3IJ79_9PLAN|nr:type II toxin-antitoxin system VapC family toxin [Planctomicrobium piriforme]SFI47972.1 PIN domain nuclease, a component of toxin-antitoxin system (PIN domain) [Planctomicrobium piriforme]
MRLLLDTHAFLWFVTDDSQLSKRANEAIVDPQNEILVSPGSYWELAIKVSLGKYQLNISFEEFVARAVGENQFRILPIEPSHAAAVARMPFYHRDPFDRLIIAQALVEQLTVVSRDEAFDAYSVSRLW